ncbi:MAG TPA: hypothetical protein VJ765_07830 [Chitinophagaceae bacterium]|nr:hypothetical protein [Chitinophagaceae bacterium]
MKRYYLFIFCAGTFIQTSAQQIPDPLAAYNKNLAERWSGEYMQVSQYRVKGSPYFLGKAFPGTLKFADGKTKSGVRIRYDLYNEKASIELDSFFIESDNEISGYSITLPEISEYSIILPEEYGGKNLVFRNAKAFGDPKKKGFYNLLGESGRYCFVKEYKLKLVPDPVNSLAKDYKMFEQYFEYYLYDSTTRNMKKIKLNKKNILSFFQDKEAVENAIKNNNINVSSEDGVILLLTKIDSL